MAGTEIRKENSTTKLQVIGGKVVVATEPNREQEWLNQERF